MFEIAIDATRRLVRVKMAGLMTPAEAQDACRRQQDLITAMGWRSGEFVQLVEALDEVAQPQETLAAFHQGLSDAKAKPRRMAGVRQGAVARMQSRRFMAEHEYMASFATVGEAEAWLFED